ncbi:MAG TPA: prepilin-type N-terminal cleavage/methylation domain-containing protein [Candidatus Hydrothermia bacterium]|nr:prepilin-type N-terminal cleavage/methylation domain-containing protein [Candidatus Hydrothermia bacterium]
MKLKKGVTLIEVLVTISIIAIFIAIPFWGGNRWVAKNRLKNEAFQVRALLENERTTAMSGSVRRAVIFNGRDVEIRIEDLNKPLPNLDSTVAIYTDYFSQKVNLGGLGSATALGGGSIEQDGIMFGVGSDNNTVVFTAFGLCETPGEIYLNDSRNLMCVGVNAFGQVRVFSWRGAWYEEK